MDFTVSGYEAIPAEQNPGGESETRILKAQVRISDGMRHMRTLALAFEDLAEISEKTASEVRKTAETADDIRDIALNTKILGFNASIEASRSKEGGKGFGIIAQEVRTLAATSSSFADRIQKTIKTLNESTEEISDFIGRTKDLLKKCLEALEESSELLENINK